MNPLPSHQTTKIILADDHVLVRAGIRALLATEPAFEVIGEAKDGAELIQLVGSLAPDLVITDLSMPGMDGLTAISHLHDEYPGVRLLVLSMNDTVDFVKRAISNGACGYLMKNAAALDLRHAVRSVMSTGMYVTAALARKLLQPTDPTVHDILTKRQVQILTLLAGGLSSKEIAFEIGLSSKTVDLHRANLGERLGTHGTANLTLYAIKNGLVKL